MRASFPLPVVLLTSLLTAHVAAQDNTISFGEMVLRTMATAQPAPEYPAASIARKSTGVAVAAIATGTDGRVTTVTLLQAPDDDIAASVRTALRQWVFKPATVIGRPGAYGLQGRVTFYFRLVAGRGRVLNPHDIPGGPALPPGPPPSGGPARRGGSGAPPPPPVVRGDHLSIVDLEIGEAELTKLQASARPTLLDIREREEFAAGHRTGAVNIPREELVARAGIEIDKGRTVVIDCSATETSRCRFAADILLKGLKFTRVLVLLP
jgi:TonB family protein